MHGIRAMVVVVPVHNEAELLDRCLAALEQAVAAVDVPCSVRIVLDACSDESAEIAARYPFGVELSNANAVGAARDRGVRSGLAALAGVSAHDVWIANTDADSTVPPNWLSLQRALADDGADVVVGTVRPDPADLSAEHRQLWIDTHPRGRPNGHTHGANLGLRASTYLAAGGFGALAEHEDVRLVDECRRGGCVVVATDAAEVLTSGRFIGRTPGGYAGYLRAQAEALQAEVMPASA